MTDTAGLDLPMGRATARELVDTYSAALASFADVADGLEPDQWHAPSPCPGWSVADIVAHVIAIELELHGEPLPDHEPDWEHLPHVRTPIGRYVEAPIDFRRGRSTDELLAELHEVVAWRCLDLSAEPASLDETVRGPGGWELHRDRYLRVRIFDIWVHEQDVRAAIDSPDPLGGDAAWVTAGELLAGMPRVWAKRAGAPVGAELTLRVTGPGISFERTIVVGEDGRARFESAQPTCPDRRKVTAAMSWPAFLARATGRPELARSTDTALELSGDQNLGERFVSSMAVTF